MSVCPSSERTEQWRYCFRIHRRDPKATTRRIPCRRATSSGQLEGKPAQKDQSQSEEPQRRTSWDQARIGDLEGKVEGRPFEPSDAPDETLAAVAMRFVSISVLVLPTLLFWKIDCWSSDSPTITYGSFPNQTKQTSIFSYQIVTLAEEIFGG